MYTPRRKILRKFSRAHRRTETLTLFSLCTIFMSFKWPGGVLQTDFSVWQHNYHVQAEFISQVIFLLSKDAQKTRGIFILWPSEL
jgi:hypothetical protein